jgi:hypothetical protein
MLMVQEAEHNVGKSTEHDHSGLQATTKGKQMYVY